jgi:SAM-dependent methyltransferase
MRRKTSVELLDSGLLALDEIRSNFDDLWRVNRYFGGVSGCLRLLACAFERTGRRPLRVLEVGAGDGRVAGHVRQELCRQGIQADFFVLDRRLKHLQVGHRRTEGLHRVAANAFSLPFRERSFDLVICNLLLHHFSGNEAVAFLGALASVAREAVLINDIERHWLPYLLFRGAFWLCRSRVSRLDGLASIRQAYTGSELEDLACAAGFDDFEVHRIVPFRLGLVLWKRERHKAFGDEVAEGTLERRTLTNRRRRAVAPWAETNS